MESKNSRFKEGDIVTGMFGWRTHIITDGAGVRKIDKTIAPISTAIGILGMPGMLNLNLNEVQNQIREKDDIKRTVSKYNYELF